MRPPDRPHEITTAIARCPGLFVIARNSSYAYKGKGVDVTQVAREPGVRYARACLSRASEFHCEPTIAGIMRALPKGVVPELTARVTEGLRKAGIPEG
jgi:hypothetical protein